MNPLEGEKEFHSRLREKFWKDRHFLDPLVSLHYRHLIELG